MINQKLYTAVTYFKDFTDKNKVPTDFRGIRCFSF